MSVTSAVNVFQLALDAVGTRSNISAVSEESREAETCRRWYDTVRDSVFRASFWPALRKTARLALLAERDRSVDWTTLAPDPHWNFVYSLPSDYVAGRHLSTYARFNLAWYSDRLCLHTDQDAAILFYSFRNENPSAWDATLQMSVVYALAAFIAMPLTGKPSRAKMLMDQANELILTSRVAAANEHQESYASVPEWISARGSSNLAPRTRFIMPYSPLLTISGEFSPAGVASV